MSAYVVSLAHIDYLIDAAISYNRRGYSIYYGPYGDEGIRVESDTATTAGAGLLAENIASVSYRYPDCSYDQLPGPRPTPAAIDYTHVHNCYVAVESVQVLAALKCYEYQSCEHPGWQTSDAKQFCDHLRDAAIHFLPGMDEAAWEITTPRGNASRDEVRAYAERLRSR